ncbi:MAG: hypothetical protein ACP5E2_03810 [Terracidiphilus sp.]
MVNYRELAEELSIRQARDQQAQKKPSVQGSHAARIYERVKTVVDHEIERANAELKKRRLASVERVRVPSFFGRLCLSFGPDVLCTVDLHEPEGEITAVVTGPPNARELARKAFALSEHQPEQIAEEIVAGLLAGSFLNDGSL